MQFLYLLFIALLTGTAPAFPQDTPRPAEDIFQRYCFTCHGTGWEGAPVLGDRDEWQQRAAKGQHVLLVN